MKLKADGKEVKNETNAFACGKLWRTCEMEENWR
jgi:hypothetical protein